MGGLRSQLRIVQAAKVAVISLFSAPLVIPDIKKLSGVLKSTYVSQILTPLAKYDVAMLAAALQLKRWILLKNIRA
jgi:hypothetical protein